MRAALAARQDCDCKEGMFALAATRRQMFGGAALVAAVGMTAALPRKAEAKAPPGAAEYPVPADPTKEPGRQMGEDGGYGSRSQFETEVRWVNPTKTSSWVPMQNGYGIITPSGLHYERHHGGIPNIDPARHRLVIHGMVDRPMQVFARRPQAFSHRLAHLFHGMLGHDGQRADEGDAADRAAHPWPRVHVGMDRRAALDPAAADRPQAGAPPGCSPRAPTPR